jgi:hypothetical protein
MDIANGLYPIRRVRYWDLPMTQIWQDGIYKTMSGGGESISKKRDGTFDL